MSAVPSRGPKTGPKPPTLPFKGMGVRISGSPKAQYPSSVRTTRTRKLKRIQPMLCVGKSSGCGSPLLGQAFWGGVTIIVPPGGVECSRICRECRF